MTENNTLLATSKAKRTAPTTQIRSPSSDTECRGVGSAPLLASYWFRDNFASPGHIAPAPSPPAPTLPTC
jgi:hypothetical protein